MGTPLAACLIGLNNAKSPIVFGGLLGTTSGVAGGLAATDKRLVPHGGDDGHLLHGGRLPALHAGSPPGRSRRPGRRPRPVASATGRRAGVGIRYRSGAVEHRLRACASERPSASPACAWAGSAGGPANITREAATPRSVTDLFITSLLRP
ncbi:hypothetical protein OG878_05440 [Streptomyces sp. NBC_00316]